MIVIWTASGEPYTIISCEDSEAEVVAKVETETGMRCAKVADESSDDPEAYEYYLEPREISETAMAILTGA